MNLHNHFNRREMLRLSAAGAFAGSAVSWLDIAAGKAHAAQEVTGKKHKSCIVLFMSGGPSQAHTFDLKERSPYKPIKTTAPDIQISEYLPKMAKQMHHMALVRSMTTKDANHQTAHYLMRTGFRQGSVDYPHFGALAGSEIVREDTRLPNFVVLKPGSGSRNGHTGGYLGAACAPMTLKDISGGISNIDPTAEFPVFDRRAQLLAAQDRQFLDDYKSDAAKAKIESYRKAIDLVHFDKAKAAFDISNEPDHVKNLYGDSKFGQQCLGARRLVEYGVPFVEVMHPRYWDTHGGAENGQKSLSEEMDQPVAALLQDLADRGLLESTLVIWMGEFGRDISGNNHWAKAWTTGFAGCGVVGGQVIGKTDEKAMEVVERPVRVGDFVATIYKALGIDHTKEVEVAGRPIKFTNRGTPVDELFG